MPADRSERLVELAARGAQRIAERLRLVIELYDPEKAKELDR